MRLIFVRHGEPDYKNDRLTENGIIQAQSTADRLRNEDIKAVYASPMGRAVETALYTADMHGLKVQTLDFMHEIDWGDSRPDADGLPDKLEFDGHPWTLGYRLLTQNPEYVGQNNWDEHHFFKNNICLEYYDMVSGEFDKFLSGFGLIRKDGLYQCETKCDDTIALFAHGGSGAVMFSHVLNLPFPFVLTSLSYGVCSVSIINFSMEDGDLVIPRLELFNDMGHIADYKAEALSFDK